MRARCCRVAACRAARKCAASGAARQRETLTRAHRQHAATASAAEAPPQQQRRTVLVTGATDGIGRHTATRLAAAGTRVLVHGRSAQRVDDTVSALRAAGGDVHGLVADLTSLADVRRLAEEASAAAPALDCLINNAGVFAPAGERRLLTADGMETTFAVNVAAPFLLTSLLLPALAAARGHARAIHTSSISHRGASPLPLDNLQGERRYSAHAAYSLSKLCVVMFTFALHRRLTAAASSVRTLTLDPGTVNTKMLLAGWGRCGIDMAHADDTLWAVTAGADKVGKGGGYYVMQRASRADEHAYDQAAQEALWARLEQLTGAVWSI